MKIILTHEQADFDALASLLGAYLLDEGALPVLPKRLNRNLRAFLTIYGVELPFVERQDIPPQPVEKVTLVDTQSLISIKGVNTDTKIHIIDHHPAHLDLPEGWTISTDDTGANTTLFVEGIQEHGVYINIIQATLLLLGIYEDTGSLTYSRTTTRDLQAAAYLLEQGANLKIVSDFLNHPLSLQQEQIFDALRANTQTHDIQGHTVLIATGDARGMDEELSTIAHKLRNLLEPDGLFLLIQTNGGIQLIARSTTDNIDVSDIAAHFGGGGHSRAAAALIRQGDLQDSLSELIRILPGLVQPPITVAQIMSRGPQVLSADTSAAEAAKKMQRYGYEGYPVVEQGKVIGLLTRRSVDKALSHKLNLTARSLMQSGTVTISPNDSIEKLQDIMTDTGWGQIPVIQKDTGELIGIVTRTDLLKTMAGYGMPPGRQNLEAKLESALPPARLALLKLTAQFSRKQGAALYIVGGFVRDLLLDRPSTDLDLVVEGDAITLGQSLQNEYGGRLTTHKSFGTAKWHIQNINSHLAERLGIDSSTYSSDGDFPPFLDLITARTEFYSHPTALPSVERGSIKLDLHRRDFTVNTLALRLDGNHYGELYDYWGGLDDLKKKIVRVLHSMSFVDDPTRMLRAVRYEQRYSFTIEERTLQLLKEARPLLDRVSGERIRHEIDHIFDENQRSEMLARLNELGLLTEIHPELFGDSWLYHKLADLPEHATEEWNVDFQLGNIPFRRSLAYILWLLRLKPDHASNIMAKLVFSGGLRAKVLDACRLWKVIPTLKQLSVSQIVARLDEYSLLAIYAVHYAHENAEEKEILTSYITSWKDVRPTIDGHYLRKIGLAPGPRYRKILEQLRNAWLDGEISTRADEMQFLEFIIRSHGYK